MQFKVGGKGSGKTVNLLNEFLDDGLKNSIFVCFNKDEAKRIQRMIQASAEASKILPRGFKGKVTTNDIVAKIPQVLSLEEVMLRPSKGRGYLYIDNLDIALQTLASSKGYEIRTATIDG
jgi:hypothetical protein